MKRLSIVLAALVALSVPVAAADDPVAVRKALMQNNGAAAGLSGGVMKGEVSYAPAVGKAAIASFGATAAAFGDFFPEGSGAGDVTTASPKIWEDMAGFTAALGKFQTAVAAAAEASGKDGPADQATFTAAVEPVLGTCKGCHETYRVQK